MPSAVPVDNSRSRYEYGSLAEATQAVIDEIGQMGGDGGMIALDAAGNIAAPFNSQGMKHAWLTPAGEIMRNSCRRFTSGRFVARRPVARESCSWPTLRQPTRVSPSARFAGYY